MAFKMRSIELIISIFALTLSKNFRFIKKLKTMLIENASLLQNFSEMPLKELEGFINALNALAIRKRATDIGNRDKFLLRKINQTVLPEPVMERYTFLQEKMEVENLPDTEYKELLTLVDKEEKIRNKRFQYLIELSQLRNISLNELINTLGLNVSHYA